jgi:hypothetical protein
MTTRVGDDRHRKGGLDVDTQRGGRRLRPASNVPT